MTSPDKDECVRIVEELASDKANRLNHSTGVYEIMPDVMDRILAAVKPKQWPLDLKDSQTMATLHHSSTLLLTCYDNGDEVTYGLARPDMDRLCVAWLIERGVDLQHVSDCLADMGRLPQYRKAIDTILSNARGEALFAFVLALLDADVIPEVPA